MMMTVIVIINSSSMQHDSSNSQSDKGITAPTLLEKYFVQSLLLTAISCGMAVWQNRAVYNISEAASPSPCAHPQTYTVYSSSGRVLTPQVPPGVGLRVSFDCHE